MRRFLMSATAVCVLSAAGVIAQKVTSVAELDTVMKKASAFRHVDKAVQSSNAADAKTQLAIVRQVMLDSQNFWILNKKDDAVAMNKEAIAKIDALDKVLSAPTFDSSAATAAYKETGLACRACHKQYRIEDDKNEYHLKPGSVPGVGN